MISILELYRTLVLQLDIFVVQRNLREVSIHGNHIGLQKRAGHAKLSDDLAVTCKPAQMQGANDERIEIDLRNRDLTGKRICSAQRYVYITVQLSRGDSRINSQAKLRAIRFDLCVEAANHLVSEFQID